MVYETPAEQLRRDCNPEELGFATTEDVQPLVGIIGQERALQALRFGLGMKGQGFNICAVGRAGTGRTSAVMSFLKELAKDTPLPPDWCYVHNFSDPYSPRAIRLPAGWGRLLRSDMQTFVKELYTRIPSAFESEQYAQRRGAIARSFENQRQSTVATIDELARQRGFVIHSSPQGLTLLPLLDGRAMTEQEFNSLKDEQRREIVAKRAETEAELGVAFKKMQLAEKRTQEQLQELDRQVALAAIDPLLGELKQKYEGSEQVISYLEKARDDILGNLTEFRREDEPKATTQVSSRSPTVWLRRYEVNVIVDNSQLQGAPVLSELNPTFCNLFGRIEREAEGGALVTDFTMLKGGAVHQANGGYLVLPLERLLANPLAWDGLKRALRSSQVVIEDIAERMGGVPAKSLRPEPIPLDVKVILIGEPGPYYLLYHTDPDFGELFKVRAQFDVDMPRDAENVRAYAAFVSARCHAEQLRHFRRDAVARIVEYGSFLAEDQERLSTHFGAVADVVREANSYAAQDGATYVTAAHVQKAIEGRVYRSNLLEQRIRDTMLRGTVLIDTDGEVVGQVNGLTLVGVGDYVFGHPARITVSVGQGRDGVLDIEREADLGGRIHTKGVLILNGYLVRKYAQDKPLTVSARLAFEQSYSEVEGDSASCAELCALLSALADLPCKQGIAVTGSVNQWGQVQAVGGVNQKVEGFFELCRARGLTGRQGVIIPRSNLRNLMLKGDLVDAVKAGLFHVYPVDNVDQAITILTGFEAGMPDAEGKYAAGTVHGRVDAKLRAFSETEKPRKDASDSKAQSGEEP